MSINSNCGQEIYLSGCVPSSSIKYANDVLGSEQEAKIIYNDNLAYYYSPVGNYFTVENPKPNLSFIEELEKELHDWCGGILNKR